VHKNYFLFVLDTKFYGQPLAFLLSFHITYIPRPRSSLGVNVVVFTSSVPNSRFPFIPVLSDAKRVQVGTAKVGFVSPYFKSLVSLGFACKVIRKE
jgi:hypothetical protein